MFLEHILGPKLLENKEFKVVEEGFSGYLSNIKLQTARISTILQLQSRDPDRKLRINLLYTTIEGLRGVKKGFKVV